MEVNKEPKLSRAMEILKRVPGGNKLVPYTAPVEEKKVEPVVEPPKKIESAPEYSMETANSKAPLKTEAPSSDVIIEDPTNEYEGLLEQKENETETFRKLRTKLKQELKTKKELHGELETLRKKTADYESGMAVPELTAQQQRRIEELEKYEKLHNFKGSTVYQEKYANPIKEKRDQLIALAKDYPNATPEALQAAFSASTTAEQNKILNQSFGDEIGALEAKSLMRDIKKIQGEANEAEKEPAAAMARMQEENDRIISERRQRANEGIVHVSKSAWSDALTTLREDGRFEAITFKEGDSEHNEKFVRPILTRAGQEYGKTVRELAMHGLTELPKELAVKLARSDQLAHLSAVLVHENASLKERNAELESLINRGNRVNRPGINGANLNGNSAPHATGAVGPQQAGRNVLARVTKGGK